MKTVAVIGAGALARIFCIQTQKLLADNYKIIAVMARHQEHADALSQEIKTDSCTSLEDLLASFPDIVVEFAGREAAKQYAIPVLEHGSDLVIASIGALADNEFRNHLEKTARDTHK